jgi:hypothetical protein
VAKTGNKAHDMLRELPESEQAVHLGNMVEEGCTGTRAFYMGIDDDRNATWIVGCSDGSSYEVMIENDEGGTAIVLNCLAAKALAGVECFTAFASQENRPPKTRKEFMCDIARLPPQVRDKVIGQFIQNLYNYARDSDVPLPSTKQQLLKQFMRKLDRDA